MISLILAFQIGSHLLGTHLLKAPSRVSGLHLVSIFIQKSAMKLWHLQEDRELLAVLRILQLQIQAVIVYPYKLQYPVSSIQSCFSLIFVDLNLNRAGLGAMFHTNLYTLGFGLTSCRLIKLSLKRICDPRFNMIRALAIQSS